MMSSKRLRTRYPKGRPKGFLQSSFPEIYRYRCCRRRCGACSFAVPPLHQPRFP
jgi:radical SAM superfamily enzyme with C-terminal helix-hairpin-helix motif